MRTVHTLKTRCSLAAAVLAVVAFAALAAALFQQQQHSLIPSRLWIQHQHTPPPQRHTVSIPGFQPFECLASYSSHFRDVLLVMQISHRLGDSKERALRDLYSCFLPNIAQYTCYCNNASAAPASASASATARGAAGGRVEAGGGSMHCLKCPPVMQSGTGSELQQLFMAHAMTTYPHYAGYMFMQDDVVLGFWNFAARHDKAKVWRALTFPDPDPIVWNQHQNLSLLDTTQHSKAASYWTRHPQYPLSAVRAYVQGFSVVEQQRLFQRNSANGSEAFRMANSDFYYVPAHFRQQFVTHAERSVSLGVMHELAVPILFDAILPADSDFEVAVGGALYAVRDPVQKIALYNPCYDYYHKIKCSNPVEWVWLVETVMRYGSMTRVWNCGQLGAEGLTSYARIHG